jgi:hypothetical protein
MAQCARIEFAADLASGPTASSDSLCALIEVYSIVTLLEEPSGLPVARS